MTVTYDFKRELRSLYSASGTPVLVTVPPLPCLAVSGQGDPTSTEYTEAVIALYTLAYAARAALQRSGGPVHRMMPLETLWDLDVDNPQDRTAWSWTALITQPPTVVPDVVEAARSAIPERSRPRLLGRVGLTTMSEGSAAQLLHVGPYSSEDHDIAKLNAFIKAQRLAPRGRHHEIYLNDPRSTAPSRLRTILRQPVEPLA